MKLTRREDQDSFIKLDTFLQFIRSEKTPQELQRTAIFPKISNVLREVNKFGKLHVKENHCNGTDISVRSAFRFIFIHCNELFVLDQLSREICDVNFKNHFHNDRSCFHLYQRIVETNLCVSPVEKNEVVCRTLQLLYQSTFQEAGQWDKICWFEYHFSKSDYFCSSQDIEMQTVAKWDFFEKLMLVKKVADEWLQASKGYISLHNERLKAGRDADSVQLFAKVPHRPEIIDNDVQHFLDEYHPGTISASAIVHHTESRESNSFDLFLELHSIDISEPLEASLPMAIGVQMFSLHKVLLRDAVFLKPGSLNDYFQDKVLWKRFQLRDDYQTGKLSKQVVAKLSAEQGAFRPNAASVTDNVCPTCFPNAGFKQLNAKDFNIFQEWIWEVPPFIQILFGAFINKATLKSKTSQDDLKKYLRKKIEKMYFAFNILLNCQNKLHFSLLQEEFSKDLLLYHNNARSVFDLTSQAGITTSLRTVENFIAEAAREDKVYFSTYIKPHKLTYMTLQGLKEQFVTLRDCHVIVMLDNLVRLLHRSDPRPGESRTGQKCLLPITLQGLPKDSQEASLWHDNECNSPNDLSCLCKEKVPIKACDIREKIINLLPDEEVQWEKFQKLSVWACKDIWKFIPTSEWLSEHLNQLLLSSETQSDKCTDECVIEFSHNAVEDEDQQETLFDMLLDFQQSQEAESDDEANSSSLAELADDLGVSAILDTSDQSNVSNSMSGLTAGVAAIHLDQSGSSRNKENDPHLKSKAQIISQLKDFGFEKYTVESLLTLHPPPAVGRDDDLEKLHEILKDLMLKLGILETESVSKERMLIGVDYKIGKNLFALLKRDPVFHNFIPEFPPLHLRKSKINTFFSAYKESGIFQILMYMRDDNIKEWSKLAETAHIDDATRTIKRIGMGLQLAFFFSFIEFLPDAEAKQFILSLESQSASESCKQWHSRYVAFISEVAEKNATFALHKDWLDHCCEISAVYMAERLGGKDGYNLLLAAVKHSLHFSFLNGAGSYGPFCIDLLFEHYEAGSYNKNLKTTLFSTPIYDINRNMGCDTKREVGHKFALKAFTPGSSTESTTRKMSSLDDQYDSHAMIHLSTSNSDVFDSLGWNIKETDIKFAMRVASLVLRQNALKNVEDDVLYNMYTNPSPTMLSNNILDSKTKEVGEFLVYKYVKTSRKGIIGEVELPKQEDLSGPPQLVKRAFKCAGNTLKRTCRGAGGLEKTKYDLSKETLTKKTKRNVEVAQCLSSDLNTCQAMVTPAGQKHTKQKSVSVPQALKGLLKKAKTLTDLPHLKPPEDVICSTQSNIFLSSIKENVQFAVIEFAGVKFKGTKSSGQEYLDSIVQYILKPVIRHLTMLKEIVICEEKYGFTPDVFKDNTRQKRQSNSQSTVAHLRTSTEILSRDQWNIEAIRTTSLGKSLIGNYLARKLETLDLETVTNIEITVDSELYLEGCTCVSPFKCQCASKYAVPVVCKFGEKGLVDGPSKRANIKQRKGEAEMSVCDWVVEFLPQVLPGQAIVTLVTSGDIDAVVIQMFTLAKLWTDKDVVDRPTVYVILQKPGGKWDVYNITGILNLIQAAFGDPTFGCKLAVILCIGGNDFLPGFSGMSHSKLVNTFIEDENLSQGLLAINREDQMILQVDLFTEFVAALYQKTKTSQTFNEIREETIRKKRTKKSLSEQGTLVNHPRMWMPPKSAIEKLADLVQFQIFYLETVGRHDARLPVFNECPCISIVNGCVTYNFGDESHINTLEDLVPSVTDKAAMDMSKTVVKTPKKKQARKRLLKYTPQKGQNRKKNLTSTPKP